MVVAILEYPIPDPSYRSVQVVKHTYGENHVHENLQYQHLLILGKTQRI